MTTTLETLLKDPRVLQAERIVLQAGKNPTIVDSSGTTDLANLQLSPLDIFKLLSPIIPDEKKTVLMNQPMTQFQATIENIGHFDVIVSKESNSVKVILKPMESINSSSVTNFPTQEERPETISSTSPPKAQLINFYQSPLLKPGSLEIDRLLREQVQLKASDLHISANLPPILRMDGDICLMEKYNRIFTAEETEKLLWEIMPALNREEFKNRHDTDFAYELPGTARFRCNIFLDHKGMGGVFRAIPNKIITAESLGFSQEVLELCFLNKGFILVTGPTGSGKSTTLCALIDYINRHRTDHIITIEDPIEFVHEPKKCLIHQREVHNHTNSFKDALRAALREDPDIILVGELRDLETMEMAIETAETGHLVFGTLHTSTAASTVDRIIDQFPSERQAQIRIMLSDSLKAVISQTLCKKKAGGRTAAFEILMCDSAVSNLIREGKTFQIPSIMQTGKLKGMVTLNETLLELVRKHVVEPQEAYLKSADKINFESMLKRAHIEISNLHPVHR